MFSLLLFKSFRAQAMKSSAMCPYNNSPNWEICIHTLLLLRRRRFFLHLEMWYQTRYNSNWIQLFLHYSRGSDPQSVEPHTKYINNIFQALSFAHFVHIWKNWNLFKLKELLITSLIPPRCVKFLFDLEGSMNIKRLGTPVHVSIVKLSLCF